jgi:4-amino-4-deoxychorismate lyase
MILVNGVRGDAVAAMDRGLAYGDGAFRTFPARNGSALHWQRQYAKLARDCEALAIAAPSADILQREISSACAGAPESVVKITVTRGAGARGYAYTSGTSPTRIVAAAEAASYPSSYGADGIRLRRCSLRLSHQPALAGLKHLNRLENVLARREWSDPSIVEGILLDWEEHVIGGTMSNVFAVTRGALATPRLDACGVAGVTRDRVIEAASALGIACAVTALSWNDLLSAGELFVVNSLAGIWPVRELDGAERIPGPVTRTLQRALRLEDDAQVA